MQAPGSDRNSLQPAGLNLKSGLNLKNRNSGQISDQILSDQI
jgi:hypothetical protein